MFVTTVECVDIRVPNFNLDLPLSGCPSPTHVSDRHFQLAWVAYRAAGGRARILLKALASCHYRPSGAWL